MNLDQVSTRDERFVVAFYGVGQVVNPAQPFFLAVLRYLEENGLAPNKLSVGGNGHTSKMGDFKRNCAKLNKTGFGGVRTFCIVTMKPDGYIPIMDYIATAAFACDDNDRGYGVVAIPISISTDGRWKIFAGEIARILTPAYGIAYTRELRLGPAVYALGMRQGLAAGLEGEAYEESRNISRWSNIGMKAQVYRKGLIRDIYPLNFLTEPQLNRPVGRTTLEKWILADSSRGKLSPFESMQLWEVEESRIPEIRQFLREADVIFDWRKHSEQS